MKGIVISKIPWYIRFFLLFCRKSIITERIDDGLIYVLVYKRLFGSTYFLQHTIDGVKVIGIDTDSINFENSED